MVGARREGGQRQPWIGTLDRAGQVPIDGETEQRPPEHIPILDQERCVQRLITPWEGEGLPRHSGKGRHSVHFHPIQEDFRGFRLRNRDAPVHLDEAAGTAHIQEVRIGSVLVEHLDVVWMESVGCAPSKEAVFRAQVGQELVAGADPKPAFRIQFQSRHAVEKPGRHGFVLFLEQIITT